MKVEIKRVNDAYHMEATGSGNVPVHIDAAPAIGGVDAGVRPTELILMGLGGCSAVDIISILKKQRQDLKDFRISIDAQRKDATPAVFEKIHLTYFFSGKLEESKVERAIELSMKKYCSVTAMLEKTAEITYSFRIEAK